MEVKYRISEEDYVNSVKLFGELSQLTIIIYIAGFISLAIMTIFASPIFQGGAIGGLMAGLVVYLYGLYRTSSASSRRRYRSSRVAREEIILNLDEYGLRYESLNIDYKLVWNDIFRWRYNDSYVLIYLTPRIYFIVPRALTSQSFDVAQLMGSLNNNVGMSE